MISSNEPTQTETPNAVRSAEHAAVAKRGGRAAEKAVIAASNAIEAATESAEAAKSALAASTSFAPRVMTFASLCSRAFLASVSL